MSKSFSENEKTDVLSQSKIENFFIQFYWKDLIHFGFVIEYLAGILSNSGVRAIYRRLKNCFPFLSTNKLKKSKKSKRGKKSKSIISSTPDSTFINLDETVGSESVVQQQQRRRLSVQMGIGRRR